MFSLDADENGNAYFRFPFDSSTDTCAAPEQVRLFTDFAMASLPIAEAVQTFSMASSAAVHQLTGDFCKNSSGSNVLASMFVFSSVPQVLSVSGALLANSPSWAARRLRISRDCAPATPEIRTETTTRFKTVIVTSFVGSTQV